MSKKVVMGVNDLRTINPVLASEWNCAKNTITPEEVSCGCGKKVWWKCAFNHEWQATIASRNVGCSCPYCAGQRVIVGVNDLETVRPEIAKQWDCVKNNGVNPSDVCYSTSKKYWWLCDKGHSWQAAVGARYRAGCPVCAGKKALAGFNDLATVNPKLAKEWDFEKNTLLPSQVTKGSKKKVWWQCNKGHSWQATIANRSHGRGCPYCSCRRALQGYNDLATLNPALAKQWDYAKNYPLTPTEVTANTDRKVWWLCEKGHSWKAGIQQRNKGRDCLYCSGVLLTTGINDLAALFPNVAKEWDCQKNRCSPDIIHPHSNRYAWWRCERGHSWQAVVSNRTGGRGCPFCAGQRVIRGETDLATVNPKLAKEWDYEKNYPLTPSDVMANVARRVWWLCEKGHSFKSAVASRNSSEEGCPYCYGRVQYEGRFI